MLGLWRASKYQISPGFCASRQGEGAVASGTFGDIGDIHVSPFAIRLMARLAQYLSHAFFQLRMGFPERSFQPRSVQSSHHSRASASESLAASAKSYSSAVVGVSETLGESLTSPARGER